MTLNGTDAYEKINALHEMIYDSTQSNSEWSDWAHHEGSQGDGVEPGWYRRFLSKVIWAIGNEEFHFVSASKVIDGKASLLVVTNKSFIRGTIQSEDAVVERVTIAKPTLLRVEAISTVNGDLTVWPERLEFTVRTEQGEWRVPIDGTAAPAIYPNVKFLWEALSAWRA